MIIIINNCIFSLDLYTLFEVSNYWTIIPSSVMNLVIISLKFKTMAQY